MAAPMTRRVQRLVSTTGCIGAALIGLALWGCNTFGGSSGGTGQATEQPPAQARQHSLLENIPLPQGFTMVPERSVAHQSGQTRVAQCEFRGHTDPDGVSRFYVRYMPTARFTLRQKRFDNGEYMLRFESDTEECNVRVKPGKLNTTLVIDISPLPKGPVERKPTPTDRQP